MAEYIEREAAISYIKDNQCKRCSDIGLCGKCAVLTAIKLFESIPAADVRPVVRGKWVPDYDYAEYDFDGSTPLLEPRKYQDGWQCSLCGQYLPSKANFCPNCGADMREPPKFEQACKERNGQEPKEEWA